MPKATVLSEIPKRETIYATLRPDRQSVFYITSNIGRMEYRLYRQTEKGVVLTGRAGTPNILEDKYIKWGPARDLKDNGYEDDIVLTPFELQEHEDKRLGIIRLPVSVDAKQGKGKETKDE